MIGNNFLSMGLLTPKSLSIIVNQFQELLAKKIAASQETEIIDHEGKVLDVELSSFFLVKVATAYPYDFLTLDPDGDKVFYCIDWGDGETQETDFHASEEEVTVSHTWDKAGDYIIKAKAQDTFGAESDWGELEVSMPRSRTSSYSTFLVGFLERFMERLESLVERFLMLE